MKYRFRKARIRKVPGTGEVEVKRGYRMQSLKPQRFLASLRILIQMFSLLTVDHRVVHRVRSGSICFRLYQII